MAEGLRNPGYAAEFLQCSIKQVHTYCKRGDLRYVDIGCSEKRPRRMFTDADLIDFVERRTRREACPSTNIKARRSGTSTSKCEVLDFTALQARQTGARPRQ